MQIKVKDTRMHTVSNIDKFPNGNVHGNIREVPVAEAKLVLIKPSKEGAGVIPGDDRYWFLPILISETEKIETGDWGWSITHGLVHLTLSDDEAGKYKVLALPEHFSPKHLQAIVDGKMKDGDKVLVEFHRFRDLNPEYPAKSNQKYIDDKYAYLKLNSSNHITLHKLEEKMYTKAQLKQAYEAGASQYSEDWGWNGNEEVKSITYEPVPFDKWFEQNVK